MTNQNESQWVDPRRERASVSFTVFCYTLVFCIALALFLAWAAPAKAEDYNRTKHFGSGWIDADGDCQSTRQEVLIRDSLIPVTLSEDNCKVISGLWLCEFTGKFFTSPGKLDIDHRVPLKAAWLSGADDWPQERRVSYANDLSNGYHLLAVKAGANRSKGAKNPAKWMPQELKVKYLLDWLQVKQNYDLTISADDLRSVIDEFLPMLGECRN